MNSFINTCPQGVFQKQFCVDLTHVDSNRNITPGALARLMQDVTEAHMDEVGLGYRTLRDKGLLWFIVWSSVWITKLPKQDDAIVIRTWPGEVKLGMYSRRYAFYTEAGEELLVASSLFMMIDEQTRKMVPPNELPSELAEIVMEGQPVLPKQRLKFPELPFAGVHTVTEQEIDKNGHVNNAYYLDWAYELLSTEYMEKHSLTFFWIQYSKELMLGLTVAIQHTAVEKEAYIKGVVEGDTSFQVKFEFQ